jgi:Flp pilus assembly protein TadG
MSETKRAYVRPSRRSQSGQAFIEFTFVALMMFIMLFGLIDFSRFLYEREVMVNLSREGSNLASRGTSITGTVSAVVLASNPLNLTNTGAGVIVTAVTNYGSGFQISEQLATGGITSASSKIGNGAGTAATLPANVINLPPANQTLYITEVFCTYHPVTPIGKLLQVTLPPTNYDAAYFTGL